MRQGLGPSPRKRRESLNDTLTAPVYTDAPKPPYLFIVEHVIYSCYRFAPGAARGILPDGIEADAGCIAIIAIYRHGPGWGMPYTSGGWLAVVVEGFPAPDTAQAAWVVGGFIMEPSATLLSRHYADFAPGRSEIRIDGRRIAGNLWSETGHVCEMVVMLDDAAPSESSSMDRYLGRNTAGEETSSIWSATGPALGGQFESLTWGEAAPQAWRDLSPAKLEWGTLLPRVLFNLSEPTPLRGLVEPTSVNALLAGFDGSRRAACVVSRTGQLLQANALARDLLKGTAMGATGRILPHGAADRSRVLADLGEHGSAARSPGPFLLPRAMGQAPLIAQIIPSDPSVIRDGAALVLLSDPDARRDPPRADLLQLLNLTPAEARVASMVGAGLNPSEAALRLGLSVATVRSTLKVACGKLGVKRQTELVRLVARLDPG